ncbi:MAG: penicillin-binding transpeptidase domain-containing protein [Blautia sp.]|nr:penicillin-binding transpeptidase domain-containing protein [Blautia sp.]
MFVISAVFVLLFAVILGRVFSLQIVNGKSYQDNFAMRITKPLSIDASRGCIYDCQGNLLAYNELAYTLLITDSGVYSRKAEKNEVLNSQLAEILTMLNENKDSLCNSFKIDYDAETDTYSFNISGTALNRFRADVFGRSSVEGLKYNEDFGFDELNASASQIMEYLLSEDSFDVDESYPCWLAYEIVAVRYAMKSNSYARYIPTTIAEDVSDRTVAYINEHMDTLIGVDIKEDTIRRYNYSEYFSGIIGYTGKISDSEYEELHAKDASYTTNDVIGKAGLEQFYESYLRGKNGEQKIYADNVGRVLEVISSTDSVAGDDLYLSLDAELQKAVYLALEQEIAGIVYANIKNHNIPAEDVYFALINNSVVDITRFDDEDASDTEREVFADFTRAQKAAIQTVEQQLTKTPVPLSQMSEEVLDDFTLIISILKEDGLLLSKEIDETDSTYKQWRDQRISPREYLTYCIAQHWIDISLLTVDEKYADTNEIYEALCDYILKTIAEDTDFSKLVYEYMVYRNEISPRDLCVILFEQGTLDYDDSTVEKLKDGTISPYSFLLEKINNIEITPAQLALDPCTGSCVITDVNTGAIKALVSYPGYDNNKFANGVDAAYFDALLADKSNPMWNYATQEQTAPGSTFKMVTATAAMAENLVTTTEEIQCTGKYYEVSNEPTCWIYPNGTHGKINISESLRDSCNVFHYTLGYRLALKDTGIYNDAKGISYIQKYASLYGLDKKSGLEIEESTPDIATQYPVMAAIGQSNNNYTTVSLSRYVTAVASGRLYSYQLMDKIVDADGKVVESYEPEFKDISDTLTGEQWDAIHTGMRQVVENLDSFHGFSAVTVAGKTGTAQQVETRPNHALFVGYAPYDKPEISIATRIAYGYSSHNAASAARNIISYYYGEQSLDEILGLKASGVNGSSNNAVTD